jgi:hypothetical protein
MKAVQLVERLIAYTEQIIHVADFFSDWSRREEVSGRADRSANRAKIRFVGILDRLTVVRMDLRKLMLVCRG